MIEVPKTALRLGTSRDLQNISTVFAAEVTAIVDLGIEEPIPPLPRQTNYCRFHIADDGSNSDQQLVMAVTTIRSLLDARHTVLLCCAAGLSRSIAVGAVVVSGLRGRSPDECLKEIAQLKRTDVNPQLWNQLRNFACLDKG